jgi:hypothetical protein
VPIAIREGSQGQTLGHRCQHGFRERNAGSCVPGAETPAQVLARVSFFSERRIPDFSRAAALRSRMTSAGVELERT